MLATDEELTSFDGSVELLKDHIERQLTKNSPNPPIPFTPEKIVEIAIQAGEAIMDVYENADDFEITQKGDESPLTKADIAAHEVIVAGLQSIDSTPIVSEEGRVGDPMSSNTCWLVDPLDGTKEFIKRNGMFTVNIALMQRNDSRWETPVWRSPCSCIQYHLVWGRLDCFPAKRPRRVGPNDGATN